MENKLLKTLKDNELTITSLAKLLNVNKSTASRWVSNEIPANRILEIEAATGIPRSQLRPDLYCEAK